MYNPFDVLLLLDKRDFRPWWFETGTPTFLVQWLRQRQYYTPQLEATLADDELLSAFDVEHIQPEAMLWQTGYLTVHERAQEGGLIVYRLGLPNLEVRTALNRALLTGWLPDPAVHTRLGLSQRRALARGDWAVFRQGLQQLCGSIPYDWYRNNPIAQYEGYWASVFYSHLAALGLELIAEDVTNQGCIDLTVKLPERIYLFEFKVVPDQATGQALAQLRAKAYADKYRADGRPLHLVGIEFSRQQRNVVGFEVETR